MKLNVKDVQLADGRWLRYKGKGAINLPSGPKWIDNAMWKHPEGLCVIATVEMRDHSADLHVSLSHRSREVSHEDCTLVADAFFPVGAVVESRGEFAEFAEGAQHANGKVVHLMTPVGAVEADTIPQATRQALGRVIERIAGR